ncbi:SRPBCC family protein [Sinomicrobium weinanense]|uniref:SRPBCC family protein n=1 Tax=Sinomicrobium weinanense TaxID=2842200 RepID=A0A926JRP8_9FLAO|nr:SRPBCC family protein [Sinomicrobium weinanense]MBC9796079.1 SRPBCC family protein [Sinomicrobium weinanense]MBU3124748.1 SRPBCC family protein [Sinomicrobium weinanense]
MRIESPKTTVNKTQEELFHFLTDIKNFETLMPENTSRFEVLAEDKFVFALKGMPEIVLQLKDKNEFDRIVLGAASDKLPFTLTAHINSIDEGKSEAHLVFDGEFNAMMGMMIKGPITSFIGTLSNNMTKIS